MTKEEALAEAKLLANESRSTHWAHPLLGGVSWKVNADRNNLTIWQAEFAIEVKPTPLATPEQIENTYKHLHLNHDENAERIKFSQFVDFCEIETINTEEIDDVEFMCDRLDIWNEYVGISTVGMPQ